jgi:hypothetical protein
MDQEGGGNRTVALLPDAVAAGMTTAANVEASFRRLFKSRIQLGRRGLRLECPASNRLTKMMGIGMLDPPTMNNYNKVGP